MRAPGQNEAWIDQRDGLAWAHKPPPEAFDTYGEHRFCVKRFSLAENIDYLDASLSLLWANRETGEVSCNDLWAHLQELHERGITTTDEHRRLGELLANNSQTLYRLKQTEFEELAARYFTVEDILTAGDYESHELKPIFCLRRI